MLKKAISIIMVMTIVFSSLSVSINLSVSAVGLTYYVSSTYGSDTNNGLSAYTPFRTFNNIKALRLGSGDKVLLRRGDVWNERLEIHGVGTSSGWVYVGPYGSLSNPAPKISLSGGRDDICVLVQDLIPDGTYNVGTYDGGGVNYIHIDNLTLENARIGIYFRAVVSRNNNNIMVTDCNIKNMEVQNVWNSITTDTQVTTELGSAKGNLDRFAFPNYYPTGGGCWEFITPTGILLGGVKQGDTMFQYLTFERIKFENCNAGITTVFYNTPYQSTKPFKNIKIQNISNTRNVAGLILANNIDGGYDGTPTSTWGIFKNLKSSGGNPDISFLQGPTSLLLDSSSNVYITDSWFDGNLNNGRYDGGGIDFETACNNLKFEKNIVSNNDGQGVLLSQGDRDGQVSDTPQLPANVDIVFNNNLFYNNLRNATHSTYTCDITVYGKERRLTMSNNRHVSPLKTGQKTGGITPVNMNVISGTTTKRGFRTDGMPYYSTYYPNMTTATMAETGASITRNNTLPNFQTEVNNKGLQNAQATFTIVEKAGPGDISEIRPTNIGVDLFTQSGSFSRTDGIITGNGTISWVPQGFTTSPKNMPTKIDITYDMYVLNHDEHSGFYFGTQAPTSGYGDDKGFLFYANKWGVFAYSSTRGHLGIVPIANLPVFTLNSYNKFRVNVKADGSVDFYVNGYLVMSLTNVVIAQTGGGYLGFNTTGLPGFNCYVKNVRATF